MAGFRKKTEIMYITRKTRGCHGNKITLSHLPGHSLRLHLPFETETIMELNLYTVDAVCVDVYVLVTVLHCGMHRSGALPALTE